MAGEDDVAVADKEDNETGDEAQAELATKAPGGKVGKVFWTCRLLKRMLMMKQQLRSKRQS
ncbi:hypothetical protein HaLaN_01991 [Haematococcus lacustris]|uniref:Uncharacterized protein n=1 Tax=Haematococcus lacustris TaxID=44745 RepID=A0A699YMC8_HAELA|nr:hypothetical protein HaLaN_01991 [Haematococcus lacustris]